MGTKEKRRGGGIVTPPISTCDAKDTTAGVSLAIDWSCKQLRSDAALSPYRRAT